MLCSCSLVKNRTHGDILDALAMICWQRQHPKKSLFVGPSQIYPIITLDATPLNMFRAFPHSQAFSVSRVLQLVLENKFK